MFKLVRNPGNATINDVRLIFFNEYRKVRYYHAAVEDDIDEDVAADERVAPPPAVNNNNTSNPTYDATQDDFATEHEILAAFGVGPAAAPVTDNEHNMRPIDAIDHVIEMRRSRSVVDNILGSPSLATPAPAGDYVSLSGDVPASIDRGNSAFSSPIIPRYTRSASRLLGD